MPPDIVGRAPAHVPLRPAPDWAEVRLELEGRDAVLEGSEILSRVRGSRPLQNCSLAIGGHGPFRLKIHVLKFRYPLLQGTVTGRLTRDQPLAFYRVPGPCRLEVACETADVDLALGPSFRHPTPGLSGFKQLRLPGERLVMVSGNLDDEESAEYRLSFREELFPPPETGPPLAPVLQILGADDTFGSGAVVSASGLVLTCQHVIEGGDFTLGFCYDAAAGARERYRARVVRSDAALDLALLQITSDLRGSPVAGPFPFLRLGPPPGLRDPLELIGFPGHGWYHHRGGLVIKPARVIGKEQPGVVRVDASVTGGFSGGAALDGQGRLIGLVEGVVTGPDGIVFGVERIPAGWLPKDEP